MLTYKLASAVGHGSVRREDHGLVHGCCPDVHLVTKSGVFVWGCGVFDVLHSDCGGSDPSV